MIICENKARKKENKVQDYWLMIFILDANTRGRGGSLSRDPNVGITIDV